MEENKEKQKKLKKRVYIPKTIRLTIIGVIAIILLFSTIKVYDAYNKPKTTTATYEALICDHNSFYDYKVYLKNNTIYEDREYLLPGEGRYFRKIVDHINASFTYNVYIDKIAEITCSYTQIAELQTNLWNKTYLLIPQKQINSYGKSLDFTEKFPIDYQYYEAIVKQIDEEIGIMSSNQILVIKFNIFLDVNIQGKNFTQFFNSSINVSLGGNLIDISENLTDNKKDVSMGSKEIFHKEVDEEKSRWTIVTFLFLIIFVTSITVTKNKVEKDDKIIKTFKKIMKKYGEWIVEIEKSPNITSKLEILKGLEVMKVKTFDDLIKISEELGKPIIHLEEEQNKHNFFVFDDSIYYQYILSNEIN